MKIEIDLNLDKTLLKALAHAWNLSKTPSKKQISDWLMETVDRNFDRVLEAAYKDGVIGKYWKD